MKFSKVKLLVGTLAILPALAMAEDVDTQSGFSVGAGGGIWQPTGDRDLDSGTVTGFNGAYRFDPNWEVEVTGLRGDADGDSALASDADISSNRLNFNYYFANGHWQPYVSVGAGQTEYEYDNGTDTDDSPFDIGAGLKYFFNPSWYARGDVRAFTVDEGTDNAITFSVGHMFGQHKEAAPVDSDGDGVTDDVDQCPGTPAGVAVDEVGCPLDSDGDGVLDYMDQCPNSTPGAAVDEAGCEAVTMSMNLVVEFANDSDALQAADNPDIQAAAAFLSAHSNISATIEGHTDSRGPAAYNQALSERRAKAAAKALVEQGVAEERISVVGYGESQPIADNSTAEGRQTNRRIVALLEATESAKPTADSDSE